MNATVTPVSDAPVLSGDNAITVAEGGTVVVTTADLSASDVDNTNASFTVTAIRAVRIKNSGKMAGENPEHPYPDGDVEHTVIVLVLFTFNDFFHGWLRVPNAF